jgi:hypothetical protein
VFKHIDYLSTVSGGGYLGCSLSAQLADKETRYPDDMLSHQAVAQLRSFSNYLAPGGAIDALRIPALLLRGFVVNLLVLLPYIVLAVGITELTVGTSFKPDQTGATPPFRHYFAFVGWVVLLVLAWMALTPVMQWSQKVVHARERYDRSFAWGLALVLLAVVIAALPTALSAFIAFGVTGFGNNLAVLLALMLPYLASGKAAGAIGMLRGKIGLALLGLLAPVLLLLIYVNVGYTVIYADQKWIYLAALAIWALALILVNINHTSLHPFYRDRLSKAYLFELRKDAKCIDRAGTLLSNINQGHQAPYHLINCAVNISGPHNANARSRQADFFVFSKHYVGCPSTGYCSTRVMEAADRHLDLGTAMAISGAAAAPNAGMTTIGPLVLLMALLNVRLGYWLPNPKVLSESTADKSTPWWARLFDVMKPSLRWLLRSGPGPVYLVYEALRRNRAARALVNVSDGGHIENLGIYELLRRRCRFIIASDAEADANTTFGSLAALIRFARLDLGIEIDIDLTEIRRNQEGLSRRHCTLGRIYYPGGHTGQLLYIKSSMSGAESEMIREYRTRNASFPHETTADQFFDEGQFEAYRALGQQCARSLFESAGTLSFSHRSEIESWFNSLRLLLRPQYASVGMFVELQKQLGRIHEVLADPALADYSYQLYPEVDPERRENSAFGRSLDPLIVRKREGTFSAERLRKVVHVCNLQLELMENVFIALELDRERNREHYLNRGWMNLFRRWSQAAYFRLAWSFSIGTFSVGFQHFCRSHLALGHRLEIVWREVDVDALTFAERKMYSEAREVLSRSSTCNVCPPRERLFLADVSVALGLDESDERVPFDFPVGFVLIAESDNCWQIRGYRIRDFYRGMDLWDCMLASLRARLNDIGDKRCEVFFDLPHREDAARYHHVFERHGFVLDKATLSVLKHAPPPPAQSIMNAAEQVADGVRLVAALATSAQPEPPTRTDGIS